MKLFNKVSILFASLTLVMGAGLVGSNDAKEVKAESKTITITSDSNILNGDLKITFGKGKGSTAPTWYAAGLRFYGQNTITITSEERNVTNITFNWEKQGKKDFASATANVGNYVHPSTTGQGIWTGSSDSIIFTLGSGQLQLNTLSYELEAEVVIDAQTVINLISEIGDVKYTDECKTKIDAARKAYDKADSSVKSEVDKAESNNTNVLIAAETKYENLGKANSIDILIDSIGEVKYTKESKELIDKAQNEYEIATSDVKELVSKTDILNSAIARYAELEKEAKENAKIVSDEIDNLPTADEITDISKKTEIDKVKADYDKLSEEEKALVDLEKVNKLNNLLDKLATFQKELVAVSSGTLNNSTFTTKTDECYTRNKSYYGIYNGNYIYNAKYIPSTIDNLTISYKISVETYGGTGNTQTISIGAYFNDALISNLDEYTVSNSKSIKSGKIVLQSNTQLFELRIISNDNSTSGKFIRIYDASFSYFYNDSVTKFANDWAAMRIDGGANGICEFLKAGTEKRNTLDYMLARFDNLTNSDELANYNDGDNQTSILDSINYVKNVIAGTQPTDKDYTNSGVVITSNYSIDSTSLIALFALLGIGAISAYYFIEKKKLSK